MDVIGISVRRARLSCRSCGAVVTTSDLSRAERANVPAVVADHPATLFPPSTPSPLEPYVSAILLRWAGAAGEIRGPVKLDKGSVYRLWRGFDRFLAEARVDPDQRARYAALAEVAGTSPAIPDPLPPFGEIVGLLHARCYDGRAVVASLAGDGPTHAIAERVECARRWLAGPGRPHCWIDQLSDATAADRAAVGSLLSDGLLGGPLTAEQRQALFATVFGTSGGPPTRAIIDVFGPGLLARSVETHLRDGTHPLRDRVLAALDRGVPLGAPELVGA